jgi:hypothetical protein
MLLQLGFLRLVGEISTVLLARQEEESRGVL